MAHTLVQELTVMHDAYARAIDIAVGADDFAEADRLAAAYDEDAVRLLAEREGRPDLIPVLLKRSTPDTPLRRLAVRLRLLRAA